MSEGPDKTDELYPIAVLIDELKVWATAAFLGILYAIACLLTMIKAR
jgi:hypothetical protein